jgi:hypothetical protein
MQNLRIEHNGFFVNARPCQLAEDGRWTVGVTIDRTDFERTLTYAFGSAGVTCGTEIEAVTRSLDFGKRVVDGQFPRLRLP